MNTKNQRKVGNMNTKSLLLAACTLLAVVGMTASEAAAQQCRTDVGIGVYNNAGFGHNTSYRGFGNSYNVDSNFNNRFNSGYGSEYGAALHYNDYPNNRRSWGLGSNIGNGPSRYDYRNTNSRSRHGLGYFGNTTQQPVAYRHGNHVDVEDGSRRIHVTGRGY